MPRCLALLTLTVAAVTQTAAPAAQAARPVPPVSQFFDAAAPDAETASAALTQIAAGWKNSYVALIIDMAGVMRDKALVSPFSMIAYFRLIQFLEHQTGQSLGDNLSRWRDWAWSLPYDPHPGYAVFKSGLTHSISQQRTGGDRPRCPPRGVAASWSKVGGAARL